ASRRGVHLDARPRHRLGRRRPRHQCRRAERRKPSRPAHRTCQSPDRRAVEGAARAGRFEVVECQAALEAAEEGARDTPPSRPGALDVLAQHVLGTACAEPFDPDELFREVTSASLYQGLTREGFEKILRFVSTGGYALATYERYAKLKQTPDGRYRIAHPRFVQQYRLNVGTIVEAPMGARAACAPAGRSVETFLAARRRPRARRGGRIFHRAACAW